MSIDEILKITGAVLGIASGLYTLWRLAWADKYGKWGRMREDYKFSKEFFAELNDKKPCLPTKRPKAIKLFQALNGLASKRVTTS